MPLTSLTITVKNKDKKQAQRIAKKLGFTLSSVMRAYLKSFLRNKRIPTTIEKESIAH